MTITNAVIKDVIRRVLAGKDYRIAVVKLIDDTFLQYAIDFFGRVVGAKLKNQDVTVDWYKAEFLNPALDKKDIAIHSGLNMKTIENMYGTTAKPIVLDVSAEHYDVLLNAIQDLTEQNDVDLSLTIKFRTVSVDLNINESLIVINTLAVKRAALRGGFYSATGLRTEKPLMRTLCALFSVPSEYFEESIVTTSASGIEREADFNFVRDAERYRCEIKLMGKGNPESADAAYARDAQVFVADTISELGKAQFNESGIYWVELRDEDGYQRFGDVLTALSIPHQPFEGDVQEALDKILPRILPDDV